MEGNYNIVDIKIGYYFEWNAVTTSNSHVSNHIITGIIETLQFVSSIVLLIVL